MGEAGAEQYRGCNTGHGRTFLRCPHLLPGAKGRSGSVKGDERRRTRTVCALSVARLCEMVFRNPKQSGKYDGERGFYDVRRSLQARP